MLPPEANEIGQDGWRVFEVDTDAGDVAVRGWRERGFSGFFGVEPPTSAEAVFLPGVLVISPGARPAVASDGAAVREALRRFVSGDWGDEPPERRAANAAHLAANDGELRGTYPGGDRFLILVSTWDRRVTVLATPGET